MRPTILALIAASALLPLPSLAATDAAVLKDLTAVIALHGLSCGEVTQAERKGDNDYVATCTNGSKYRVYTRDGRVVVEKL